MRKVICPFWQMPLAFHVFDGMEGLRMLLKRLAYPYRYSDMIPRFGLPVPEKKRDDQCCFRLDLH